jgi:hypothetical protein
VLGAGVTSSACNSETTSPGPIPQDSASVEGPVTINLVNPRRVALLHVPGSSWSVSKAEAERADAVVEGFLRHARPDIAGSLATYYGQIYGVTDSEGRSMIHLNFFCERHRSSLAAAGFGPAIIDSWRSAPLLVSDGGACYFRLDVDPRTGEVRHFMVNGDA